MPGNNLRAFNCGGGSLQPWHQGDNEQGEDAQAARLKQARYEKVSPSKMGFKKHFPPKYFCWKGAHLISPIIMLLTTLATML